MECQMVNPTLPQLLVQTDVGMLLNPSCSVLFCPSLVLSCLVKKKKKSLFKCFDVI